jgi:hypothetical protein
MIRLSPEGDVVAQRVREVCRIGGLAVLSSENVTRA